MLADLACLYRIRTVDLLVLWLDIMQQISPIHNMQSWHSSASLDRDVREV